MKIPVQIKICEKRSLGEETGEILDPGDFDMKIIVATGPPRWAAQQRFS